MRDEEGDWRREGGDGESESATFVEGRKEGRREERKYGNQ